MVGFYKHDIARWMDGTESLPDDQYRVYHVVCELIYLNEGPIALNERGIAGRCNQDIRKFRPCLKALIEAGKLSISDGKIVNNRAEEELELIRKNRENAAKGGRTKRGSPSDVVDTPGGSPDIEPTSGGHGGDIEPTPGWDQPNNPLKTNDPPQAPLQTELSLKEKRREEKSKKDTRAIKLEFDNEFWPLYPHKTGRPIALKSYTTARGKTDKQTIIDGLHRYIKTKPPDRSWLNPSTFLNQERWGDEPDNGPASHGGKSSEDKDWEIVQRA